MLQNASVVDKGVLAVRIPGSFDTIFHLEDDTTVVTIHGHGRLNGLPEALVFGDAVIAEEVVGRAVLDETDIDGGLIEEITNIAHLDDAFGCLEERGQVDEVKEHHDEHEEVPESAEDASSHRARGDIVTLQVHGGDHIPGRVRELEALALLGGGFAPLRLRSPFVGAEVADEEEEDSADKEGGEVADPDVPVIGEHWHEGMLPDVARMLDQDTQVTLQEGYGVIDVQVSLTGDSHGGSGNISVL